MKRTIGMTQARSRALALIAKERGVSAECLIQEWITAGILLAQSPAHCARCRKRKANAG